MPSEQKYKDKDAVVARCRFIRFRPSAVRALALDRPAVRAAVAREAGDIELWRGAPKAWRPVVRRPVGGVSSLAWAGERCVSGVSLVPHFVSDASSMLRRSLFACDDAGSFLELCPWTLRVLSRTPAGAGALWSIAAVRSAGRWPPFS